MGIEESESLTGGIAQIGLREVILQPRHHTAGGVVVIIEVEGTRMAQVVLNLRQPKLSLTEAHSADMLQMRHKAIRTVVNALTVNPDEGSTPSIIVTHPIVDGHRVKVMTHQCVNLRTDAPGVEAIKGCVKRSIVAQRKVVVRIQRSLMATDQRCCHDNEEREIARKSQISTLHKESYRMETFLTVLPTLTM